MDFSLCSPPATERRGKSLTTRWRKGHIYRAHYARYLYLICVFFTEVWSFSLCKYDTETLGSLLTSLKSHIRKWQSQVWVPGCLALKSLCQDFSLVAHPRPSYDVAKDWYWHPAPTFSFHFLFSNLVTFCIRPTKPSGHHTPPPPGLLLLLLLRIMVITVIAIINITSTIISLRTLFSALTNQAECQLR